MLIKVDGGTGAGTRRIKEHPRWWCCCFERRSHPGSLYACPDCGKRRPKDGT